MPVKIGCKWMFIHPEMEPQVMPHGHIMWDYSPLPYHMGVLYWGHSLIPCLSNRQARKRVMRQLSRPQHPQPGKEPLQGLRVERAKRQLQLLEVRFHHSEQWGFLITTNWVGCVFLLFIKNTRTHTHTHAHGKTVSGWLSVFRMEGTQRAFNARLQTQPWNFAAKGSPRDTQQPGGRW